jgi:hypothetical protein
VTRALYIRGDPYETSDAVFGVKESLIVDLGTVSEVSGFSEKYGVPGTTKLLRYDFSLASEAEVGALRHAEAVKSAGKLDNDVKVVDGTITY